MRQREVTLRSLNEQSVSKAKKCTTKRRVIANFLQFRFRHVLSKCTYQLNESLDATQELCRDMNALQLQSSLLNDNKRFTDFEFDSTFRKRTICLIWNCLNKTKKCYLSIDC